MNSDWAVPNFPRPQDEYQRRQIEDLIREMTTLLSRMREPGALLVETINAGSLPVGTSGLSDGDIYIGDNGELRVFGSGSTYPYIFSFYYPGTPNTSESMLSHLAPVSFTFPAGMADSQAECLTPNPSIAQQFDLLREGNVFGNFTFAANSTTATFNVASDEVVNIGDKLTVRAPSDADTIDTLTVTLLGQR
jgi:hypothetical protein